QSILFLCTGNYYRSRFAEIVFKSVAKKMGLPWTATSRGLALERGVNNIGPMAMAAVKALEAMRIRAAADVGRFPQPVTPEDFEQADLIIALKRSEHRPLLQERHAPWAEKIEFWHIDDAADALSLIEQEIMQLIARLFGGGGEAPRADEAPSIPVA